MPAHENVKKSTSCFALKVRKTTSPLQEKETKPAEVALFILCGVNHWSFVDFYWLELISLLKSFDSSKENKVFYSYFWDALTRPEIARKI